MDENFKYELEQFAYRAAELKNAWNRLPELEKEHLKKEYPFDKDLPTLVREIAEWRERVDHMKQ
ncbi:hypothetical protein [Salsuginibacillus kocurii]|uniref:hypothetical protein n=1 Tax=Salsuginibacillus kocurii TaxID=427078 RepID=UPI0003749D17|nr:hypothetical protein [Salsuginibacillus kocurii]